MSSIKKEKTFNFFKANPKALFEEDIEIYLKELGIKKSTYNKHRNEFISITVANSVNSSRILIKQNEIKREKFVFDDNKLFGF